MRLKSCPVLALFSFFFVAVGASVSCGDDTGQLAPDVVDIQTETQPEVTDAPPATAVFDLAASASGGFYDFPYPSDLRTDARGHQDLTGFQGTSNSLVRNAVALVQDERSGFSPQGAVYFRFDGPLEAASFPTLEASRTASSGVQLMDIDPTSPDFGARLPVYVTFHAARDEYWAENTLVARTVPGVGMHPGRLYAAFLTRALRSEGGGAVLRAAAFETVVAGGAQEPSASHYAMVLSALEEAGVSLDDVITATAFTTSDPALEMDALRVAALQRPLVAVTDWEIVEERGAFVTYSGRFTTTEFISDDPPYSSPLGKGQIRFNADGTPETTRDVAVRFAVTVPTSAPPAAGYPLLIYGHGTGGDYLTHADASAEGAFLSTTGIATLGFDAAMHGDRPGSSTNLEMVLATNPVAGREAVRQTVVDLMIAYHIAGAGGFTIPASVATTNTPITFDVSQGFYMGHSQGSQEAGLLLGVEPAVGAAFLSAGGGGTVLSVLEHDLNGSTVACAISLVLSMKCGDFTAEHPLMMLIIGPLMEGADPLNFAHRFLAEPIPGDGPTHIVMSEGTRDALTPPAAQEALAVAIGLPLIEPVAHTSASIDLLDPARMTPPAQSNITAPQGAVTGGLIQFEGKGHFAIYTEVDARNRYVQFFATALTGAPVIVAPR